MAEGLHPDYYKWVLDTLYNQRGVVPFNPDLLGRRYPQFPGVADKAVPGNINEPTPNITNIPPEGTPSWQELLGDRRMPFPANRNIPGGSSTGSASPVSAPEPVPPAAAPSGIMPSAAAPSMIGTTLNTASRFLPPWAQAGIAAGRAMWPTPTAPPSRDEAPPWSWPRQGPNG